MIDSAAHDAVETSLSPSMLVLRGETVRGRRACGHLMNAVPGLRSPVQGASFHARRPTELRPAMRVYVVPVHRMRDVKVDAHQRRSCHRRVVCRVSTARLGSVRFLRRNAHALEGVGPPHSVLQTAEGRMESTITGTVLGAPFGGA